MQLTQRTILVTGGSAGIGLALARRFLELGNTVLVTGRNLERLDAAAAAHPGLKTFRADAADPESLVALRDHVDAELPTLDLLINNAGVMDLRSLGSGSDDLAGLTREVDVNISGVVRTVSLFVDRLRENRGDIVNVSSGLAFAPFTAAPIYSATKAFVHSYTISLRKQLAGKVGVFELMPPTVRTEMTTTLQAEGGLPFITPDELVDRTVAALEAGHTEIRPGISNQLHWMARIAPGYIQGQLSKSWQKFVPEA